MAQWCQTKVIFRGIEGSKACIERGVKPLSAEADGSGRVRRCTLSSLGARGPRNIFGNLQICTFWCFFVQANSIRVKFGGGKMPQ